MGKMNALGAINLLTAKLPCHAIIRAGASLRMTALWRG